MSPQLLDRTQYRKVLLDHYLAKGFEDDDDLLFYVKEFLGFEYPRKAFCSHHDAPSQILCDIYFERITFILLWANRTGGKTRMVSLLNHLDALFKGPIEICNAGAALDQSTKGYQYFLESFEDPLLKTHVASTIQSKTTLRNGSVIQVITGSMKGLNGPHPTKTRLDEVELMEWQVLEEGLSMSKSFGRVKAQDVLSSTRKVQKGPVQRLLDERETRHLSVRSYCIWDCVERCDRQCHDDPVWGNCPIYHLCGGKAHSGLGWYPVEDLIKKGLNLTKNTFEAQWENKRPTDAPLVYGDYFDRDVHVRSWTQLYELFKVDEFRNRRVPSSWLHVGGIDFGSNFAFLLLAREPTTRTWILFYEYFFDRDRRLIDHVKLFRNAPGYENISSIFADPAAKQDRVELRALGVPTLKAVKDRGSVLLGIDEVKVHLQRNAVLGRPKFYIVEGAATNTVKEFELWSWTLRDDGTADTEDPQDEDNHCLDALRYAMYSYGRTGASYQMLSVEGI